MLSIHINFPENYVADFLKKNSGFNKFEKKKNNSFQTHHYIFYNRLSEYFQNTKDIEEINPEKSLLACGSKPEVGSSSNNAFAFLAKAIAIPTFWRIPLE